MVAVSWEQPHSENPIPWPLLMSFSWEICGFLFVCLGVMGNRFNVDAYIVCIRKSGKKIASYDCRCTRELVFTVWVSFTTKHSRHSHLGLQLLRPLLWQTNLITIPTVLSSHLLAAIVRERGIVFAHVPCFLRYFYFSHCHRMMRRMRTVDWVH